MTSCPCPCQPLSSRRPATSLLPSRPCSSSSSPLPRTRLENDTKTPQQGCFKKADKENDWSFARNRAEGQRRAGSSRSWARGLRDSSATSKRLLERGGSCRRWGFPSPGQGFIRGDRRETRKHTGVSGFVDWWCALLLGCDN